MSSDPIVSIGVPVYNGEKYLSECLESIINQTYQNWECYVINNQSSDNSLAIAEKTASKDKRMHVITNATFVDMTTNFNNTFKYISDHSNYFKVVCADDWIFPEFLERMVGVMEKYPEIGICSSYRIDNKIVHSGLDYYKGPRIPGKELLLEQLLNKIDVVGSETTVLYRIDALKKMKRFPVIFNPDSYHFDTSLANDLLSLSDAGFIFQVLSYTRRHEDTYTSKYVDRFKTSLNFREDELYRYKSIFPVLNQEYKKVRAEYGVFLLKKSILRDTKCLEWHNKRLNKNRKFGFIEYIRSLFIVYANKINYRLKGRIK